MAASPAAQKAQLTLALMRAGAPNMAVLNAKTVNDLLQIAQEHGLVVEGLNDGAAPTQQQQQATAGGAPTLPATSTGDSDADEFYTTNGPEITYRGPGGQYEGERNANGEWEGKGVYRFSDGTVYEGEVRGHAPPAFFFNAWSLVLNACYLRLYLIFIVVFVVLITLFS